MNLTQKENNILKEIFNTNEYDKLTIKELKEKIGLIVKNENNKKELNNCQYRKNIINI